jgi:3-deoxy-7-phosphoheptulonate synthase
MKGPLTVLQKLNNVNVLRHEVLTKPDALKAALSASESVQEVVSAGRQAVNRILPREDPRLLVVVGPCSIHDPEAAREYG